MIKDAEAILKICGMGSYLHIGCGENKLVFDLLKRSVDAYGIDASTQVVEKNLQFSPGHFAKGTLSEYPFPPETFDTLIIGSELLNFALDHLPTIFAGLRAMAKRNLVLYFPPDILPAIHSKPYESSRLFWEKLAINAGFRHHPRNMLHTPYHEYENEKTQTILCFERIPTLALNDYPLPWLLAKRDLHMDMSREAGRCSDSHVSRYVLAASKIRSGDIVLDAGCGLGYGTAILAACSKGKRFIGVDIDASAITYANANFTANTSSLSYEACDITHLAFLPDHSVDVVVSFAIIEHLENYGSFLSEVKRVLKPDGRFIGSVPNLWCDETGNDPNPYHHHVFDWNKLQQAVSRYFIVEDRWAQTAGGGFKLQNAKREMINLPITQAFQGETEWWLISACADPRSAKNIPYSHPLHTKASIPMVIDFGKYYDNPWLYRTMVQLGERITNRGLLTLFCVSVANDARPGSADHGAALCVLAYQILETGVLNDKELTLLINAINKFDQSFDCNNPHAHHWAISLHYVAARILLMCGKRDDALTTFLTCAQMDPLRFSPLLATKTISACMYAGLILVGNGDLEEAKKQFSQGVKAGQQALQADLENALGDIEQPLIFGFQEMAKVADLASQCAQALLAIQYGNVPGDFWERVNLKRFGLVEWAKSMERENEWLRKEAYDLNNVTRVGISA